MTKQQPTEDAKELWEDLGPDALRTARYLLRKASLASDLAEDIVQLALLKYHQLGREKRSKIVNHKAYLAEIVRHEIANYLRDKNTNATSLVGDTPTLKSTSDERDIENRILLQEIWSELEDEDRRLLELMIFNYSGPELAWRLGISKEAARQRTHRLKAKLKVMLTESQKIAP